MWKRKLQKILGNLLEEFRKLHNPCMGRSSRNSRPQVIENSREYLLL